MNTVVELPYGLPGRIYRGRMPFSAKDPEGRIFSAFQELGVSVIVLLAGREECLARSGRDLVAFYTDQGLEVIYLPVADFNVPDLPALSQAVEAALRHAWAGRHIAVHCFAGYGRTGMFLACLARHVFKMTAAAAILWVREYVPGAVEVAEQMAIVERYDPNER